MWPMFEYRRSSANIIDRFCEDFLFSGNENFQKLWGYKIPNLEFTLHKT